MRKFVVLVFCIAACTKPNPNVCCATAAQCDALGVDDLRPCGVGQACMDFKCVASECDTSADCGTDSPICSHGLCIGTCQGDEDCMDVAGREHCSAQGVCVGCTDASDCPASAAICDAHDQVCRGCERDDECASGVCIEADGTCAAESALLYVSTSGHDTGTCTKSAPCETLEFALGLVSSSRGVIRLLTTEYYVVSTTVIDKRVVIDAPGGAQMVLQSAPAFDVRAPAAVTIETMRVVGGSAPDMNELVASGSSSVRFFGARLDHVDVAVTNGSVDVTGAEVSASKLSCTNGALSASGNKFDYGKLEFSNCQVTAKGNRWEPTDNAIDGGGGLFVAENNVFVVPSEFTDLIIAHGVTPGSRFAFNTIVNTSAVQMSPVAVTCDASLDVSSNIIAYNSTNPLYPGCTAHDSLFDPAAGSDATGNAMGDPATFFVDKGAGDYHLSPTSPARGIGEAGIVTTDFDGAPRPQPVGSRPDVGAYEAP